MAATTERKDHRVEHFIVSVAEIQAAVSTTLTVQIRTGVRWF